MVIRNVVDAALWRLHLELVTPGLQNTRRVRDVNLCRIDSGHGVPRPSNAFELFEVPLHKLVSAAGFTFGVGGWHPFTAALSEPDETPAVLYKSVLSRFYAMFQPRNVAEAIIDPEFDGDPGDLRFLPSEPWTKNIWRLTNQRSAHRALATRSATRASIHFGPVSSEFIQGEKRRLQSLRLKIDAEGYQLSANVIAPPVGYLVVGDSSVDYRFVLLHGNHRAAVLTHLGFDAIHARLSIGYPSRVDASWIHRIASRPAPPFSEYALSAIHQSLLHANGHAKALRLGIL